MICVVRAFRRLETITGDDTLIVEISMQYCDNYGSSCTDASVVAVNKGFTNSSFEKLKSDTLESLQEGPAQAHMQALNLTEGMCAPAMAWLA